MMKHLITLILALTVVDVSIIDSNGDRSKSLVVVTYSDGTEDKLIVDKSKFDDPSNVNAVVSAAMQMIEARTGK